MLQQIDGGCSSLEYDLSTRDVVEVGGVVAEKLALLFHIQSKIHIVCLDKIPFSRDKSCGSDKLSKYGVLPAYLGRK